MSADDRALQSASYDDWKLAAPNFYDEPELTERERDQQNWAELLETAERASRLHCGTLFDVENLSTGYHGICFDLGFCTNSAEQLANTLEAFAASIRAQAKSLSL